MTEIVINTELRSDHRLVLRIPGDFPVGPVTVTVAPSGDSVGQAERLSPMGRRLLAIRRRAHEQGLVLKTTDEILAEIRADRGEQDDDPDLR